MRTAEVPLYIYIYMLCATKVPKTIDQYVGADGNREVLVKNGNRWRLSAFHTHLISKQKRNMHIVISPLVRTAGQDSHFLYDLVRKVCVATKDESRFLQNLKPDDVIIQGRVVSKFFRTITALRLLLLLTLTTISGLLILSYRIQEPDMLKHRKKIAI